MTIWVLAALLALPGAAPAPRLRTPPLPPGTVCGGPTRELADVPLSPQTTYAQVLSAWGEPRPEGPAGEISSYYLTCDAWVWLSFESGGRRRLTRAILFTGSGWPTPRLVFNNLEITRHRRCNQLRPGRNQSGRMIARVWGPPDNEIGSGIVRWIYDMAGGGFAQVFREGGNRFSIACTSSSSRD